jgi:hypothetical protein
MSAGSAEAIVVAAAGPGRAVGAKAIVGPAAIILGRAEARFAAAAPPPSTTVVTLTPAARAALVGSAIVATPSSDLLSDRDHARAIVRCLRARERAIRAAQTVALSPAARDLMLLRTIMVAGAGACLWQVVRRRPEWLLPIEGAWVRLDAPQAHARLLGAINGSVFEDGARLTLGAGLANLVLRWSLRWHRPVVFVVDLSRGADRLAKEMLAADPAVHVVGLAKSTSSAAVSLRQSLANLVRHRSHRIVRAIPCAAAKRSDVRAAETILDAATEDPVIARSLTGVRERLARQAGEMQALSRMLARLARSSKLRAAVVRDSLKSVGCALAEASAAVGVPCMVASHATVGPWQGAIEATLRGERNRMMTAGPGTTIALAQSPAVARAARQARPGIAVVCAPPIIWSGRALSVNAPPPLPARATFLWAGNYQPWGHRMPWFHETPDEMVEALARLAEAVQATAGLHLEVRVKPNWTKKADCDGEALERLLPTGPHRTIGTFGSFADALARSICVISHDSTAIEEAFLARRPVLLWGTRGRSQFLEGAATTRPEPGRRSAVYAPAWSDDLAGWLRTIAAVHGRALLTDEELAGHVWPPDATSLGAVAAAVLGHKLPSAD